MEIFDPKEIKKLFRPKEKSSGEDNGQITIIGGSSLFHGAPILALKTASRIVDMVFFATPEKSVGSVAEGIKSKLLSFIWIPWEETEAYIAKSDAILIGPGFMRFGSEHTPESERDGHNHEEGRLTKEITEKLFQKFPDKKWVIDAGSLQVIKPDVIPNGAIVTPNSKEYQILFGETPIDTASEKHKCIIVLKGPETIVSSLGKSVRIVNGNPGMTKGGTGDVLAGLVTALFAKNDAYLSAASASYIEKFAADELFKTKGTYYNSDDLAEKIPEIFAKLLLT